MEKSTRGMMEEQATIPCCIPMMSIKLMFYVLVLVLLFLALCMAVFAGEPEPPGCDLQSGLAGALNLSREQCENMRQLTEKFHNDTAITRGKVVEKRLELRSVSVDPKANPHAILKIEQELNVLEKKLSRKAHRTEADQRKLLTPEQIGKMKDVGYRYGSRGYGRRGYGQQ